MLGPTEERVLVMLGNLTEEPTATQLHRAIEEKLSCMTLGALYLVLDRMLKRDLVARRQGEPSPKRGGKANFFYKITETGRTAVLDTQRQRAAFGSLPDIPSGPPRKLPLTKPSR